MLPLQLLLLILGAGNILIIDGKDGFRCFTLCRLDSRPETGPSLEDCVSIFNVLGLPEVKFLLIVLTIADVTALSAQTGLAVSSSIAKILESAELTEAMLEAHSCSICSDFPSWY